MKYTCDFCLDLGKNSQFYSNLLSQEDFDFKTKDIIVSINNEKNILNIKVICDSLIDLKIGSSSVMKSLEIIEKIISLENKNESKC